MPSRVQLAHLGGNVSILRARERLGTTDPVQSIRPRHFNELSNADVAHLKRMVPRKPPPGLRICQKIEFWLRLRRREVPKLVSIQFPVEAALRDLEEASGLSAVPVGKLQGVQDRLSL